MARETIGWPGLLAALENGEEQADRTARRWRRFIATAIFISCLLTAAYIGWALIEMRDAWHTGEWQYFWDAVNGSWPLIALGARFVAVDDPFTRYADATRTIQEAAIGEDEHVAPVAQEHSQLSQDSSTLYEGVRYGPLKQPRDGRSTGPIVLIVLSVIVAVILGLGALAVGVSGTGEGAAQVEEIFGGITLILLLLSIWPLVAVLRMRRGIVVTADESGISWKQLGLRTRWRSIAWHETRAFFVVTQRKSTNWVKETTWVLMGPSGALAWMAPTETVPQTDTPHARFAALVAARTQRQLRDLSAFVDQMTNTKLNTEQNDAVVADAIATLKAARTQPEKAEAWLSARRSEQATEAWLAASKREQTAKKSGLGWGCTVQLALVGVIALVYAGGWGLEQYQPHYYEGMLAQIHAGKPLYHDDLTYDNGDWDATPPTSKDYSLVFKDGAYHMTGTKGYDLYFWLTFEHDDAAVEVTARQVGTSDNDGVGLVLRASENGSDAVMFYVDSTGSWWLWHYRFLDDNPDHEWTELGDGHSDAIRTGSGAENRLLVLMHGGRYTCYINGRFVETYNDESNETPRSGHMGVFLNDGATEGVFTDFTMYPAPPPSIWSAL
ncbi:MAG: hypothetical protein ACXWQZ_01555 [Ktedonobacterales bacterium]